MRIKKDIEGSLVEWVIAEPQAFPELKAMPFVFARVLPVRTNTVSFLHHQRLTQYIAYKSGDRIALWLLVCCIYTKWGSGVGKYP